MEKVGQTERTKSVIFAIVTSSSERCITGIPAYKVQCTHILPGCIKGPTWLLFGLRIGFHHYSIVRIENPEMSRMQFTKQYFDVHDG